MIIVYLQGRLKRIDFTEGKSKITEFRHINDKVRQRKENNNDNKGGKKMFCKKCGKEIPEGSRFCPVCGTEQEEETVLPKQAKKKKLHKYTIIGIIMLVIGMIEDIGPTRTMPLMFFLIADALFIFAYLQINKEADQSGKKANTVLLTISVILTILEFAPQP